MRVRETGSRHEEQVVAVSGEGDPGQKEMLAPVPAVSPVTWHLAVAYDGTDFHGWQIQPGQRTVQGEIQDRLRRLFGSQDLRLVASSRTDAGVHALDQQVSFVAAPTGDLDAARIRQTLNRWLPREIKVLRVARQDPAFHARHSARGKAYTYAVYAGEKCHPLYARYAWHLARALDTSVMQRAADALVGEHDFASFAVNPKRELETTVCAIHRLAVIPAGEFVYFDVVGTRFLYKMVRSLVGYLIHLGRGTGKLAGPAEVLAARDRCAAAESAPAQGLFLARVFFAADDWQAYRPVLPPFRQD